MHGVAKEKMKFWGEIKLKMSLMVIHYVAVVSRGIRMAASSLVVVVYSPTV